MRRAEESRGTSLSSFDGQRSERGAWAACDAREDDTAASTTGCYREDGVLQNAPWQHFSLSQLGPFLIFIYFF